MLPNDTGDVGEELPKLIPPQASPRKYQCVYRNILGFGYYHLAGLYGLYLIVAAAKWETVIFTFVTFWAAAVGITAGAHRLWTHRAYKATQPFQIFLMICHSLANQHSVAHWVRDHRMHHKYSETDADPHNATRGFFYSHIGWLLVRKHPEVKTRGKLIDMSDIYSNPVLMFQHRHSNWLIFMVAFIVPTIIPVYFWGETISNSWHTNMLRFITNLNLTFLVNSAAHMFGHRPYDKSIAPSQNLFLSLITLGEGFHNYHHVFPYDYRAAELGNNVLNSITRFIDLCAWLGLAYDLRCASGHVIQARSERTGDGKDLWGYQKKGDRFGVGDSGADSKNGHAYIEVKHELLW